MLDGGEHPASIKRCGDLLGGVEACREVDEDAREFENGIARRQADWLKCKGLD